VIGQEKPGWRDNKSGGCSEEAPENQGLSRDQKWAAWWSPHHAPERGGLSGKENGLLTKGEEKSHEDRSMVHNSKGLREDRGRVIPNKSRWNGKGEAGGPFLKRGGPSQNNSGLDKGKTYY